MNEPDTTSRASNLPSPRGRVFSILAIVLGIAVLIVLFNQNVQQTAREQRLNEKFATIQTGIGNQTTVINGVIGQQTAIEQRLNGEFTGMDKRLSDLLESGALFPDKSIPAAEAVALAKKAIADGDKKLARIYYLSAINHAPSEFQILNDYANLILADKDSTVEDTGQLKSVLQISLYQIPPNNIASALSLVQQTIGRENDILAASTPKPIPVDWAKKFIEVTTSVKLDDSDLEHLTRRWQGLNEISEALTAEQADPKLRENVEHELNLTRRVINAGQLLQSLDVMLKSLDESVDAHPEKAVSILQSAESTIAQLWGIDPNGWPESLKDHANKIPDAINTGAEKVALVKSRSFIEQVSILLADAKNLKMGSKFQPTIDHLGENIKKGNDALQNISSVEEHKNAEGKISEMVGLLQKARQAQFNAYQKWAVGICDPVFKSYRDTNFTLAISRTFGPTSSNTLALNIFDQSDLKRIDESSLSPEVLSLYKDILGKLFSKMSNGNGADGVYTAELEIANSPKTKLESF
jgi:hypothetical protein